MSLTLHDINHAPIELLVQQLGGLYEHSPWIVEAALQQRPFASVAQLRQAMVRVLDAAGTDAQLALIRAHPELAGKAMVDQTLTAHSTLEQSKAGLAHCSAEEFETLHRLNREYTQRFGFPFILAVRGPRGTGLGRQEIIATFARRLHAHPQAELQECLRNIHRIAEIRLNEHLGLEPAHGNWVWDRLESLAQHSEAPAPTLTVTYLSPAHRACATQIAQDMRQAGCDEVFEDAVGNVVGRYHGTQPQARALLSGSHYDTVRNAGRFDGRLGIYVPLACVRQLHQDGRRLPFGLEVVAFAEEEGQRYKATFLGSSALTGDFRPEWLEQTDAQGIALRQAMQSSGLDVQRIGAIRRDPARYLGFVEVHIEQGPVLNHMNLPLGVVTSINASVRYQCEITGVASHAGTTPMGNRADAAVAAAQLLLYCEQRAASDPPSVATVGMLQVPQGSINVVPGRCLFSLDLRAPSNAQRDALERDVLAQLQTICHERALQYRVELAERADAAPCDAAWAQRWEQAIAAQGLPVHRLPSGAGHDAMKIHTLLAQAMLFVRGQNGGISHNPLESTTNEDIELTVRAFQHLLDHLHP